MTFRSDTIGRAGSSSAPTVHWRNPFTHPDLTGSGACWKSALRKGMSSANE